MTMQYPNWIGNQSHEPSTGSWLDKVNPHDGQVQSHVARSGEQDIDEAVASADRSRAAWASLPGVERGRLLFAIAAQMESETATLSGIISAETGKSPQDARGEVVAAIALARFYAAEGQRLFGRTTTSGIVNRFNMTFREPIGIAGLIIAANTPLANAAWKVFPALVCGNSVVLKAAETAPGTAWCLAQIAATFLPPGVLNVIQGLGAEAGEALIAHPRVGVLSFTGSTAVGKRIATVAAGRMARVSLELGGKNALVVCDDCDLDNAIHWGLLSAFSNAGQRCAAASRIVVMADVYEPFRQAFIDRASALRVGNSDTDYLGPVITLHHLQRMLAAVQAARSRGVRILTGGHRLESAPLRGGFYVAPTVLEHDTHDEILAADELFGPITSLFRATDFDHALSLANNSPYGLTASIHTSSLDRAMIACRRVEAGVVFVNAGTFGSEPHMPFGGVKQSGNGSREPGPEGLDVYSSLKNICVAGRPG